ncbi:hypothetical protein Hanom_Chr06g00557241 [Helianthus anomalus]
MALLPFTYHHHTLSKFTFHTNNAIAGGDSKQNWPKFKQSEWPNFRRFVCKLSNASTYTSRLATDVYLYESPDASFDQYLEDKPRVFKAIFPDKRRSQQLND